jgi:galactose mutarotase-like enzyme
MSEQPRTTNPLEIRSPQGDLLIVNPLGGRIRVTLNNTEVLTSITRGDGKLGETHPCTPIFGPDRNDLYSLSQHGNMRNELCEVARVSEADGDVAIVAHTITDSPDRYPHGVRVEQRLGVKDGVFMLRMTHVNDGEMAAPVNGGEHCYFAAPQGYLGTLINGKDVTALIGADSVIPLEASNIINISGLPELVLVQDGFHFVALWVGRNAQDQTDRNYVCIEPIEGDPRGSYFGSSESMIQPHASRVAQFSISVSK